ncbi:mannose-1-phosphate guanylyltransferase [bacterium]|nr:mannose-1-phosphate guanylyltransferase [bacterium]MBQ6436074.1 mannose-1-phosphate guanylyltransferase [bacterium]
MSTSSEHQYVVILAGGSGTRLWPKSRGNTPKQFLRIIGKKTMLQRTADRALSVTDWDHIIVITNKDHLAVVKKQLPELKPSHILLEPEKRDTALAMLTGALFAQSLDPEAIVINSASDHYVTLKDLPEFARTMKKACKLASTHENLITVGITPTRPETGFGYIRVGEQIDNDRRLPVFKVDSFTEKPNAAAASAFIATGKYFWNANMYVWSAKALVDAFAKYAPEILKAAQPLLKAKSKDFAKLLPKVYKNSPAISIDYAISEKADNLLLIPGNFAWSDVGDWRVVYDLGEKDTHETVFSGTCDTAELQVHESHGNLVSCSCDRLIALVGVDNMIVVDTPEILLIANKEHSQDVKKIVEQLKAQKKNQYL